MMKKMNFEEMRKQEMATSGNIDKDRATVVALTPLVELLGGRVELDKSFGCENHGQKCVLADEVGGSQEVSYRDDGYNVYYWCGPDGGIWLIREYIASRILKDPDDVLQCLAGEAQAALRLIVEAAELAQDSDGIDVCHYGDVVIVGSPEEDIENELFYEPFSLETARAVYGAVERYINDH